jgi:hypothetical protein
MPEALDFILSVFVGSIKKFKTFKGYDSLLVTVLKYQYQSIQKIKILIRFLIKTQEASTFFM